MFECFKEHDTWFCQPEVTAVAFKEEAIKIRKICEKDKQWKKRGEIAKLLEWMKEKSKIERRKKKKMKEKRFDKRNNER